MVATAPLPVQHDDALPTWREGTGPLGSGVVSLRGGDPGVFKAWTEYLSKRFRKGWYDLTAGVAVFMAPSVAHEVKASDLADLIRALCRCKALAVVHLRSATSATEDKQQAADPDESFFVGEKAERFRYLEARAGLDRAISEMEKVPRDLVVEVEHSHYDAEKPTIYRRAGVRELWDIGTTKVKRRQAIWDLQAPGGSRTAEISRVIEGVRADRVVAATAELRALGGLVAFVERKALGEPVAERLLAAVGGTPAPPGSDEPPGP